MNKELSIEQAIQKIRPGDSIMVGGFAITGVPMHLIYELARHPEIRDLTTISEGFGLGWSLPYTYGLHSLLEQGQLKEIVLSYFSNPRAEKLLDQQEVKLTLIPQGTLAERIRAGGAGLGGFYTPTGVGTLVEDGKETKVIDGKKYILELPLRADVALVKCHTADRSGNGVFHYTAQNFNPLMAMAADTVILECENLVDEGEIAPDRVQLPGVFVDCVVHCGEVCI